MTATTNADLSRDLYVMKGEFEAVKSRLEKMDVILNRIDQRTARLEDIESQRKGAWKTIVAFSAGVGGAIAMLVEHFWKS